MLVFIKQPLATMSHLEIPELVNFPSLGSILFGKGDRHITAEILKKESDKENLMVSQATVYNVLNDFYNVGLLTKVNIDNDKTWYDTNVEHHYHIFNEENSELVDLEPSEIDIKIPKKFSKSKIKKICYFY